MSTASTRPVILSPRAPSSVSTSPSIASVKSSSGGDRETKVDDAKSLYDSAVAEVNRCYATCDEVIPSNYSSLDSTEAHKTNSSLAFGEIYASAVSNILDSGHLNAANATILYDLGSGNGKLAMQAFLQYPNLKKVVGCELTYSRGIRGLAAANRHSEHYSKYVVENFNEIDEKKAIRSVKVDRRNIDHMMALRATRVTDVITKRTFEMRRQNLFDATDAMQADIIICETAIPGEMYGAIAKFFSNMKSGARLLMYNKGFNTYFAHIGMSCPFVEINPNESYPCTWMPHGCHFQCWKKI